MAPAVASAAKQAELLRKDGNKCFEKSRFGAAIDNYTEAITLCPNVAVYRTNRALCYMKKNDWTKVEEDCIEALKRDRGSVKAHYMLGLALLKREEYAVGVKELERALDLGRGENPKSYMVEEIWQELARAKYLEWEDASTKRTWKLQILKQACENALVDKHMHKISQMGNDETTNSYLEDLETLTEVFSKATEFDTPTEVPDYLCCKITFDIFRDPVITPSGVTYERAIILDHLEKVGNFDPVSREPLSEDQLVPNLAIKEAVQAFLQKHGWAYKMN
ncbi:E3 ubiquitin-protein ligase CHIP isoform X1 [Cinnamomum micranthum f. kanehirae]|uniref:E3 ubiquitin-protein ligase CHIP n=1 Tax=Cinnamomum micranthum f. kanehirae TaxID=337451 RepID=A0A3S3N3I8_9MAGN|nr:E3 ubiquitin-protein ligase CHIP isoform X1 [Cinnamomum micranthum f. kanehirae]